MGLETGKGVPHRKITGRKEENGNDYNSAHLSVPGSSSNNRIGSLPPPPSPPPPIFSSYYSPTPPPHHRIIPISNSIYLEVSQCLFPLLPHHRYSLFLLHFKLLYIIYLEVPSYPSFLLLPPLLLLPTTTTTAATAAAAGAGYSLLLPCLLPFFFVWWEKQQQQQLLGSAGIC